MLASLATPNASFCRASPVGASGHVSIHRALPARHIVRALDVKSPLDHIIPVGGSDSVNGGLESLITTNQIKELESVLDNGASVAALRRFNDLLAALPAESWEEKLVRRCDAYSRTHVLVHSSDLACPSFCPMCVSRERL